MKNLKDKKGLIVVDVVQVWGQGLDLWGDLARFMIIESVPFGNLTDPFEIERRKLYSSDYAWWLAYMTVPQACGRVSRGEYNEDGSWMLNVAALADGSATTQKGMGYYPQLVSFCNFTVEENMTNDELSDLVDDDVDLTVGLQQLDQLHENWLVEQAQLDQQMMDFLGAKYGAFKLLQEKRSMLDKSYSDRKEQLRKEILAPSVIKRGASVRSRFFRIEFTQGSESVNRPALREWADRMGLERTSREFHHSEF